MTSKGAVEGVLTIAGNDTPVTLSFTEEGAYLVGQLRTSSLLPNPERGVGIDRSCSGPLGSTLQGPQITDADLLKSATLRGRR